MSDINQLPCWLAGNVVSEVKRHMLSHELNTAHFNYLYVTLEHEHSFTLCVFTRIYVHERYRHVCSHMIH